MATLTTQAITRAAITPTYAAVAGGGDACEVSVDVFLHFKNTNAATYTVSLAMVASPFANVNYTAVSVVIPATTGDKMIGPILPDIFKDATTGNCQISYTGTTTNGTVGAFKLQGP